MSTVAEKWAREQAERAALLKRWLLQPEEVEAAAVAAALLGIFSDREFVRRSRPASEDVIRKVRQLGTRWRVHQVSSTLRGKGRSQFIDWLFAPSREK